MRFKQAVVLPWLAALSALLLGILLGDPRPHLALASDTAGLIRGFALIKGVFTLAVLALLSWRFCMPLNKARAVSYLLGVAGMAGAAAMVWQLSYLGVISLLFFGGLLLIVWTGFHDRDHWVPARAVRL